MNSTHRASWAVLVTLIGVALRASKVFAQAPEFGILDNSFLVEEAFNQEAGIFQNILSWVLDETGAWVGSFTQEWPAPGLRHQLSYTVLFSGGGDLGDAHAAGGLINYRYQALTEGPERPAFSPRASVVLPSGRRADRPGIQMNLPFSKQVGNVYVHWNAGLTWLHAVPIDDVVRKDLTSPQFAGSLVWNTRPLLNLMLESVVLIPELAAGTGDGRTEYQPLVTVSPGLRGGWNHGEQQIILGAALPVTFNGGETGVALLLYFSYELPFLKNH